MPALFAMPALFCILMFIVWYVRVVKDSTEPEAAFSVFVFVCVGGGPVVYISCSVVTSVLLLVVVIVSSSCEICLIRCKCNTLTLFDQ